LAAAAKMTGEAPAEATNLSSTRGCGRVEKAHKKLAY